MKEKINKMNNDLKNIQNKKIEFEIEIDKFKNQNLALNEILNEEIEKNKKVKENENYYLNVINDLENQIKILNEKD